MRIYTIEELQSDLTATEQAYAFGDIPKSEYLKEKAAIQDKIIDLETGPAKRRVFAALEPHSNQLAKEEWAGLQCNLTALRSLAAVQEFYNGWRDIFHNPKIADLPEFEDLGKPKTNQISKEAA